MFAMRTGMSKVEKETLHDNIITLLDKRCRVLSSMERNPRYLNKKFIKNRLQYLKYLLETQYSHLNEIDTVAIYLAVLCHKMYSDKARVKRKVVVIRGWLEVSGDVLLKKLDLNIYHHEKSLIKATQLIHLMEISRDKLGNYKEGSVESLAIAISYGRWDNTEALLTEYVELKRNGWTPLVKLINQSREEILQHRDYLKTTTISWVVDPIDHTLEDDLNSIWDSTILNNLI